MDERMPRHEAILKACYEAEDFHWEEGIKLGFIKAKPNTINLQYLERLEEKYGRN